MEDPPPPTAHRFARGMEQEGAHQQRVAGGGRAQHLGGGRLQSRDPIGIEPAVSVRTGDDLQRPSIGFSDQ